MYIRIFVLFALRIYSYYVDEPLKLLQNVREKMSFFSTIHRNLFPESKTPTHSRRGSECTVTAIGWPFSEKKN